MQFRGSSFIRRLCACAGTNKVLSDEVTWIPLGSLHGLRNVVSDHEIKIHKLYGCIEVEWLSHVIGWRVITGVVPVIRDLLAI
jgi:hypothetical protein